MNLDLLENCRIFEGSPDVLYVGAADGCRNIYCAWQDLLSRARVAALFRR